MSERLYVQRVNQNSPNDLLDNVSEASNDSFVTAIEPKVDIGINTNATMQNSRIWYNIILRSFNSTVKYTNTNFS
jgi:hypothetical protein